MNDGNAYREPRRAMAPKAVASLVLAILACDFGWCWGVPGIILGVIGRNLARQAKAVFDSNPGLYRGEKIIEAGLKWSRIGLIQGIILAPVFILLTVLYVVAIVSLLSPSYY